MYAQLSKDIFRPWDAWKKDFGNWNLKRKQSLNEILVTDHVVSIVVSVRVIC